MISKAVSKYTRISPRKARLLTRPLRGMTVAQAYAILENVNKRAAYFIRNVVKSAFDNALRTNRVFKESDLYISKITADKGPMFKRYRAMSMGRAGMIRKPTSHLTVVLDAKELLKKAEPKKKSGKESIFKKIKKDRKAVRTGFTSSIKAAAGKK